MQIHIHTRTYTYAHTFTYAHIYDRNVHILTQHTYTYITDIKQIQHSHSRKTHITRNTHVAHIRKHKHNYIAQTYTYTHNTRITDITETWLIYDNTLTHNIPIQSHAYNIHIHAHTYKTFAYTHTQIYTLIYIYIYIYICIYIYACVCARARESSSQDVSPNPKFYIGILQKVIAIKSSILSKEIVLKMIIHLYLQCEQWWLVHLFSPNIYRKNFFFFFGKRYLIL